jgi:hypothetical protein
MEIAGHDVINHAGAAALRLIADRTGLTSGLSRALARPGFVPVHDRGRVLADTAVLIADGGRVPAPRSPSATTRSGSRSLPTAPPPGSLHGPRRRDVSDRLRGRPPAHGLFTRAGARVADIRVGQPTRPLPAHGTRSRRGTPSGPGESGCFRRGGCWSASPVLSAFSQLRGRAGTPGMGVRHVPWHKVGASGPARDRISSKVPANRHLRHVHAGHDVVHEPGLTHVTIYRWVQRFTPLLIDAAHPCRHVPGDRWSVDATVPFRGPVLR